VYRLEGGAEEVTAQCLGQVAQEYPWPGANPPEQLKLSADTAPTPSGRAGLEHVALLTTHNQGATRGIREATPLVRACLDRGGPVRPGLVFRVTTQPVNVTGQLLTAPGSTTTVQPAPLVSDVERCVQAVLAATEYPGPRTLLLDFSRGQPGLPASPPDQVAWYFEPPGTPPSSGAIDPVEAQAAIAGIQPQVSACWDEVVSRRGGVGGGRSLRMRVQPSGELQFVQVVADQSTGGAGEAVDYLLDRCLVREAHRASLPRPEGDAADFIYSWVFAVREL